jgi:YebC/PmpR family DNA-binding regulatory protein
MSGHSKWHNIKRRKEVTDAKKGATFTKFSLEIASSIRAGGADPAGNASLRDAIARAKRAGVPQVNIDRLLEKGKGRPGQTLTYEAVGPGGAGLIIVATTDNPNRTVGQLRTLLADHGGTLASPNAVMWKFTHNAGSGTYAPKFPLPATGDMQTLLEALRAHPDVEHIFTDAVQ